MSKQKFSPKTRMLREFAERLGYSVSLTNSGHLKFHHPHGERLVFSSSTPCKPSAYRNCMKELERNLRPDRQPTRVAA